MNKTWQELPLKEQKEILELKKEIQEKLKPSYVKPMVKKFPKYKGKEEKLRSFMHFRNFSWEIVNDFRELLKEV